MGLEMAGVVTDVGPDSDWASGTVSAGSSRAVGTRRESRSEGLLLPVPNALSFVEAASLPEVFATAYLNLFLEAGLGRGETLFVHAGASGVGIAATQLGRWAGANVITTVGSEAKADAIRALGADWIVDRTKDDIGAVFDRATREWEALTSSSTVSGAASSVTTSDGSRGEAAGSDRDPRRPEERDRSPEPPRAQSRARREHAPEPTVGDEGADRP
ncbi:MAG: zinc-binding dehydrogenase [Candidatus Eisenbacteria bacterium]